MTIRTLRHGELPPEGVTPRRYKNSQGYIRLRWPVGGGHYVECYEHRWIVGNPPREVDVHHINHVKDDNRPENLKVVTPAEHGVEHRTIDRVEARRLYEQGYGTPEIGEMMGHNAAAIYRALRDDGVRMRGISEALTLGDDELPEADIRYLHEHGVPATRIANIYGVSQTAILTRINRWGLPPRRAGRPSDEVQARADAAVREVVERSCRMSTI